MITTRLRLLTATVAVSTLLTLAGLILFLRTAWFIHQATRAPAQIIALDHVDPGGQSNSAHSVLPVFTYTDAAGVTHPGRAAFASSLFSYRIGDRITVLYDPTSSEPARIDSFVILWLGPTLLTGLSLFFGGVFGFLGWREARAAAQDR